MLGASECLDIAVVQLEKDEYPYLAWHKGDIATGVIWVTLLLAALLGINRLYVAERDQGGFVGMRLAPIDLTALWLAKAAALFLYLVVLELVALPAFDLLLLGPGLDGALPELLPSRSRRARGS